MIDDLVVGMIGGTIIALVYGLLFAQREDAIRERLRKSRQGWVRAKYVSAFVGALRGKAAAYDTSIMTLLFFLVMSIAVSLLRLGSYMVVDKANDMWQRVVLLDEKALLARDRASGNGDREVTQSDLREQACDANTAKQPQQPHRDLEERGLMIEELTRDVESYRDRSELLASASDYLFYVVFAAFYVALFSWIPFVTMRKRFAVEIERFTLRIQGLATKNELAQLAVLESSVADESTLISFVQHARSIATRHNVSQLVATFDLWEDENRRDLTE